MVYTNNISFLISLAFRPECQTDPDCPEHLACIQERCQDPCTTLTCGVSAACSVSKHRPVCACKLNYEGDPYSICRERKLTLLHEKYPVSNKLIFLFSWL